MTASSPLEIEILLHYHSSSSDFRNLDAAAVKSAINKFIGLGLLQEVTGYDYKYKGNYDALMAYISALMDIPFPELIWAIPQDQK